MTNFNTEITINDSVTLQLKVPHSDIVREAVVEDKNMPLLNELLFQMAVKMIHYTKEEKEQFLEFDYCQLSSEAKEIITRLNAVIEKNETVL